MGLQLATCYVTARGDTSNVARDFQAGRPAIEAAAQSLTGGINRILAGIGIGFGIAAIMSQLRQAASLAERQINAEARLAAVVKGTGMAAGFTAQQLREQASALQVVTTIGDEAIMEMQALMLTFKSVTGETFQTAIETALDLSAVMGQGASSAALQLGKALEDPIRGVSALRRSGVTFNEEQRKQIKELVQSNRLFEAQALVLGAVRGQLGAVAREMAKTDAGKLQQARNALGDMKEEIGRKLIPVMVDFTRVCSDAWQMVTELGTGLSGLVLGFDDVSKSAANAMNQLGFFQKVLFGLQEIILKLSELAIRSPLYMFTSRAEEERLLEAIQGERTRLANLMAEKVVPTKFSSERIERLKEQARKGVIEAQEMLADLKIEWRVKIKPTLAGTGMASEDEEKLLDDIEEKLVDPIEKLLELRKNLGVLVGQEQISGEEARIYFDIQVSEVKLTKPMEQLKKLTTEAFNLRHGLDEGGAALREFGLLPGVTPDQIASFRQLQEEVKELTMAEKWTKQLTTPIEEVRKKFDELRELAWGGLISPETYQRGLKELQSKLKIEATMEPGRFGFAEYGKSLQDAFLKTSDPQKKTAEEIVKTNGLLTDIKTDLKDFLKNRSEAKSLYGTGG